MRHSNATAAFTRMLTIVVLAVATLTGVDRALAAEPVKVYGPGGPAPAMKELAAVFTRARGVPVEIVAGPTNTWLAQAKTDAHLVFSGAENMMTGFIAAFDGQLKSSSVEPLYVRPATLLVRKGNPKGIKGLRDATKPGVKVIVTEGAGQVGMWEDVAGRTGEIALLKGFRANIVEVAANSALARKSWVEKPEIDAWLIWNHWQIANPDIADQVPLEPELTIWRATSIALTDRGARSPDTMAFAAFLTSAEGAAVFKKWGWRR